MDSAIDSPRQTFAATNYLLTRRATSQTFCIRLLVPQGPADAERYGRNVRLKPDATAQIRLIEPADRLPASTLVGLAPGRRGLLDQEPVGVRPEGRTQFGKGARSTVADRRAHVLDH